MDAPKGIVLIGNTDSKVAAQLQINGLFHPDIEGIIAKKLLQCKSLLSFDSQTKIAPRSIAAPGAASFKLPFCPRATRG
jgi:hypothetical protein